MNIPPRKRAVIQKKSRNPLKDIPNIAPKINKIVAGIKAQFVG
jgi:hypothetical protein